jgi:hypothetical protein
MILVANRWWKDSTHDLLRIEVYLEHMGDS